MFFIFIFQIKKYALIFVSRVLGMSSMWVFLIYFVMLGAYLGTSFLWVLGLVFDLNLLVIAINLNFEIFNIL